MVQKWGKKVPYTYIVKCLNACSANWYPSKNFSRASLMTTLSMPNINNYTAQPHNSTSHNVCTTSIPNCGSHSLSIEHSPDNVGNNGKPHNLDQIMLWHVWLSILKQPLPLKHLHTKEQNKWSLRQFYSIHIVQRVCKERDAFLLPLSLSVSTTLSPLDRDTHRKAARGPHSFWKWKYRLEEPPSSV